MVNCYQITAVNRLTKILIKIPKICFYAFPEMIVLPFLLSKYDVLFYRWEYTTYYNAKIFKIAMNSL